MRSDQIKLSVLVAATVVVFGWVLWHLVPMLTPTRDVELRTPGWTLVRELNERLAERPAFAGASFYVVSEDPLALKVAGGVPTEKDLTALREYLKELRPEGDYEVEVEVFGPH